MVDILFLQIKYSNLNKNNKTMLETKPLELLTKQKQLKAFSNTRRVFGSAWIL